MKNKYPYVFASLVLFTVFFLFGCEPSYTVTFETNVDVDLANIENVTPGENIDLPQLEDDVLLFVGWRYNETLYYDAFTVDDNVTLEAVWEHPDNVFEYGKIVNDDYPDSIIIYRYTGEANNLKIPQKIQGLIVKQISMRAFEDSQVASISIPVHTAIGYRAFDQANNLESVHYYGDFKGYGKSIIGSEKYYDMISGCESIDSDDYLAQFDDGCAIHKTLEKKPEIIVPDGTVYYAYEVIVDYAYHDLPQHLTHSLWSNGSFHGATSLTTIEIPDTVHFVHYLQFLDVPSITTLIVNDNHETFSLIDGVLYNKDQTQIVYYPSGLTNTTYELPETLTSFNAYAFGGNVHLEAIEVSETHTEFMSVDGVLYTKDGDEILYYPSNRPGSEYHIIDDTLTISYFAFAFSQNLETLVVADSVTSIGDIAFQSSSIVHLILGESVQFFSYSAFENVINLQTLTFIREIESSDDYPQPVSITIRGYHSDNFTIFVPENSYGFYLNTTFFQSVVDYLEPLE